MRKPLSTLAALSLCLIAGCGGGDDDAGEPAKSPETKTQEQAAPAPISGDVPSYQDVKALALKDPKVAKLCAGGGEDSEIGVGLAKGETYTRLICGGNREVLDYVVGREGFAKNFRSSVDQATFDVWRLGSEAYVQPALSGPKGLASAVKAKCGCGQTVKGGFGR